MVLRFQLLEVEWTRKIKEIRGFFSPFSIIKDSLLKYKKLDGALAIEETKL